MVYTAVNLLINVLQLCNDGSEKEHPVFHSVWVVLYDIATFHWKIIIFDGHIFNVLCVLLNIIFISLLVLKCLFFNNYTEVFNIADLWILIKQTFAALSKLKYYISISYAAVMLMYAEQ